MVVSNTVYLIHIFYFHPIFSPLLEEMIAGLKAHTSLDAGSCATYFFTFKKNQLRNPHMRGALDFKVFAVFSCLDFPTAGVSTPIWGIEEWGGKNQINFDPICVCGLLYRPKNSPTAMRPRRIIGTSTFFG